MTKYSLYDVITFFLFLLVSSVSHAQWEYVGGPENYFVPSGSQSIVQRLAFHPETLEPYVFFRESIVNVGTGPSLVKYNGTAWEEVSMMFDDMSVVSSGIFGFYFRSDNNIPVACYQNSFWNPEIGGIEKNFRVVERIGSEWLEKIGIENVPVDEYYFGCAAMRMVPNPISNDPVLVGDSENWMVSGTTTLVTHYNNQSWEYLGDDDFGAFRGNSYDMDYNLITNQPYVLTSGWYEDAEPAWLEVWVYNGSWESLGNPGLTPITTDEWRIRVSPINGDVFVMSSENFDNPENAQVKTLRISKWDGFQWELIGEPEEIYLSSALGYDLEIHPVSGDPYVCFRDGNAPNNPSGINIRRWNGQAWVNLDENNPTFSVGDGLDMVFQPETNYPYVVSSSGQLLRYVPNNTGVSESDNDLFIISPNPVVDHLNFSKMVESMKVFDSTGKLILEDHQVKSVSMSDFPNGLYIVRGYFSNKDSFVEEFIKM